MNTDEIMFPPRLKYFLAGLVKSNPYIWFTVLRLLPYFPFFLPHEKNYFGFQHLTAAKEGLFLDVGANDGLSARGFRHINSDYRIFSIEPNRYHEPYLRRLKKKLHGFDYLIIGAGSENSQITLYTPLYKGVPLHGLTSFRLDYLQEAVKRDFPERIRKKIVFEEHLAKIIRLDDLNLEPDIIKIDTEGFDHEVLVGLKKTINSCRPHILVEYSPGLVEKFEKFFHEVSYSLFVYQNDADCFLPFDGSRELHTYQTSKLQVNLFCIPSEKVKGLPIEAARDSRC